MTDSSTTAGRKGPPLGTDLLRTRQVAELLGVSPRTVEDWRRRGAGPPWYRVGPRTVVYRAGEIEAWLVERRRAATASEGHVPSDAGVG